jgi:hypothetical protein
VKHDIDVDAVRAETLDRAAEAARQRVRMEVRAAFPQVIETPLQPWIKLSEADREAWRLAVIEAVEMIITAGSPA